MNEMEAIEKLSWHSSTNGCGKCTDYEHNDAKRVAIVALEEIQQYRAIGTVEECRKAVEMMKPIYTFGSDYNWTCPACGTFHSTKGKYCSECGQKIELY